MSCVASAKQGVSTLAKQGTAVAGKHTLARHAPALPRGVVMKHVYLLQSVSRPAERYVGCTTDLSRRLAEHNAGSSPHTAKFRPWSVKVAVLFEDHQKAEAFERYLKHGSGHAFTNRHFW